MVYKRYSLPSRLSFTHISYKNKYNIGTHTLVLIIKISMCIYEEENTASAMVEFLPVALAITSGFGRADHDIR